MEAQFLGSGEDGCVFLVTENGIQKIWKVLHGSSISDNALVAEREVVLSDALRALDPQEKRFICSSAFMITTPNDLIGLGGETFASFILKRLQQCAEAIRDSFVVQFQSVAQPVEDVLNAYQLDYIATSVQMLHGAGIIHGDIHVNNVMLISDGPRAKLPVLVDWSRAAFLDSATQNSVVHKVPSKEFATLAANDVVHVANLASQYREKFQRLRRNQKRSYAVSDDDEAAEFGETGPEVKRTFNFDDLLNN